MKKNKSQLYFILDVDGVLTDGKFVYTKEGKIGKVFGAHDADGLDIIRKYVNILFISSDKKGFKISLKRVKDLGFKLHYVKNNERLNFIKEFGFKNLIFMGDGIHDVEILKKSFYGISPKNAVNEAKQYSNFVTSNSGGNGAVFEACLHLKKKFFK